MKPNEARALLLKRMGVPESEIEYQVEVIEEKVKMKTPRPSRTEATIKKQAPIGYCKRCNLWWDRVGLCHCATCCNSFSSLTGFDLHRINFECHHPASLFSKGGPTFILSEGVWSQPGHNHWARD